jgi:hypothetical protein
MGAVHFEPMEPGRQFSFSSQFEYFHVPPRMSVQEGLFLFGRAEIVWYSGRGARQSQRNQRVWRRNVRHAHLCKTMKILFLPVPSLLMLFLSRCTAQQDASMHIGVASVPEPEDFVAENDLAELVSTVRQCDFLGRIPSSMLSSKQQLGEQRGVSSRVYCGT